MEQPTLRGVTGTARALLATFDVDEALRRLVDAFGWDRTAEAVAGVPGAAAQRALELVVAGLAARR